MQRTAAVPCGRRSPARSRWICSFGLLISPGEGDDLLVSDPGAGKIVKISMRGKLLQGPLDALDGPMGLDLCNGGVVVSESVGGRVIFFERQSRTGSVVAEGLNRPTGLACVGEPGDRRRDRAAPHSRA